MKNLGRIILVLLVVSSLVMAENNVLLAQNVSPVVKYVGPESFGAALQKAAAATSPLLTPINVATMFPPPVPNVPSAPAVNPPQAATSSSSGSGKSNVGLWVGLAMVGAGVAFLAASEPTHQTTCVTYGICPVPGPNHVAGGMLIGVGGPLAIFKLIKH